MVRFFPAVCTLEILRRRTIGVTKSRCCVYSHFSSRGLLPQVSHPTTPHFIPFWATHYFSAVVNLGRCDAFAHFWVRQGYSCLGSKRGKRTLLDLLPVTDRGVHEPRTTRLIPRTIDSTHHRFHEPSTTHKPHTTHHHAPPRTTPHTRLIPRTTHHASTATTHHTTRTIDSTNHTLLALLDWLPIAARNRKS